MERSCLHGERVEGANQNAPPSARPTFHKRDSPTVVLQRLSQPYPSCGREGREPSRSLLRASLAPAAAKLTPDATPPPWAGCGARRHGGKEGGVLRPPRLLTSAPPPAATTGCVPLAAGRLKGDTHANPARLLRASRRAAVVRSSVGLGPPPVSRFQPCHGGGSISFPRGVSQTPPSMTDLHYGRLLRSKATFNQGGLLPGMGT